MTTYYFFISPLFPSPLLFGPILFFPVYKLQGKVWDLPPLASFPMRDFRPTGFRFFKLPFWDLSAHSWGKLYFSPNLLFAFDSTLSVSHQHGTDLTFGKSLQAAHCRIDSTMHSAHLYAVGPKRVGEAIYWRTDRAVLSKRGGHFLLHLGPALHCFRFHLEDRCTKLFYCKISAQLLLFSFLDFQTYNFVKH